MCISVSGLSGPVAWRVRARALIAAIVFGLSACSGGSGEAEAEDDEQARAARALVGDEGQDAGGGTAAGESTYTEGGKLIRTDESLVALGNEMFGDRVGMYSGSLEFVQNDFSIPGNSALPVGVGRRHTVPVTVQSVTGAANAGLFGDWDLEIPRVHGVFTQTKGWTVDTPAAADKIKRCSLYGPPPPSPGQQRGTFNPDEYWQGTFLYVPGSGSQEILKRNGGLSITDGGSFPLTTKDRWVIRCGVNLRNGTGEGFVAISPDGTQYTFDVIASRPYANLIKGGPAPDQRAARPPEGGTNLMFGSYYVKRVEYWILPSEVRDRHGNKVRYIYNTTTWRLEAIEGDDVAGSPRRIEFSYDPVNGRISTATAAGRTWTYSYRLTPAGQVLAGIVQPDGARWTFNLDAFTNGSDLAWAGPQNCEDFGQLNDTPYVGTMTHPSGATGSFTVRATRHGRTFVERACRDSDTGWPSGTAVYPLYLDRFSIVEKSISGPGLPVKADGSPKTRWTYAYGPGVGCTVGPSGCTADSPITKTVTVTDPDGDQTRYTFGIRFRVDEGQLLKTEEAFGTANARVTERQYANPATGPWPDPIGSSIQRRGNGELASRHTPESYKKVNQQGVDFLWQAVEFDGFAKPTRITKQGPSGSKEERRTYDDNTAKWVLSQPKRVWLQINPTTELEIERHDYDAVTANKLASHSFGLKKQGFTYNGDGTLATKSDGLNQATQFFEYKRGLAQRVVYADAASERATVDDWGLVRSVTNAVNATTSYGYDAMGRMSSITYPTGDAVAYNTTTITYEQRATIEHGLAPNHWVQTTATGSARTERFFDAQWRPMVTRTYDAANEAGTRSVTLARYDSDGKKSYESFPRRGDVTVPAGTTTDDELAASIPGTVTAYDALGRVVRKTQSGAGSTFTEYLPGFQRRTTNPRGYATTHGFQAFDEPKEDSIARIDAPEGVAVVINRDLLGKAQWITRSGGGKSVTRSYVYDGFHRLCKTIEPETGATVQMLDAADNTAWRASGQSLPNSAACDHGSVPEAARVRFTYSPRNQLWDTTYGDGSPSVSRTYWPDGKPQTVSSSGYTWTYEYNLRRLLTTERMTSPGGTETLTWGINANGHVSSIGYPDSETLPYNPNALGQQTTAGSYASNITYHPNGVVAGYTLGNQISRTVTLNTRGLPESWTDTGPNGTVLDDLYLYDANGNVTDITDRLNGSNTRSMPWYDGLDRLRQVNRAGALWARYDYDAVDNLVYSKVVPIGAGGVRELNHNINATTNRLDSLTGMQSLSIWYDVNGNITQRGSQTFLFDIGNRMSRATGVASYVYDGHGRRLRVAFDNGQVAQHRYTQSGKLVRTVHSSKGITRYVYVGDKVVAEVNSLFGVSYLHTDALGSPVKKTDSARAVVAQTVFEPYGGTASGTNPEGVGYTGHVNDPETGLVYMQQRYYEPLAGRFLSVDPVATSATDARHFSRFAYVENNPYKHVDPDGRELVTVGISLKIPFIGGATFSAGVSYQDGKWDGGLVVQSTGLVPGGGFLIGKAAIEVGIQKGDMVSNKGDMNKTVQVGLGKAGISTQQDTKNNLTGAAVSIGPQLGVGVSYDQTATLSIAHDVLPAIQKAADFIKDRFD